MRNDDDYVVTMLTVHRSADARCCAARNWPSPGQLIEKGLPCGLVARYYAARRDLTDGVLARLQERSN